jgi:hypothetical protein
MRSEHRLKIIWSCIDRVVFFIFHYTVKPVLRGHLWEKERCPYKTGDLLNEVQFI